ncbi:adenylate/guanylate cyclase domain-containing protein [Leptolyngbya sp. 'hensonii']|uniref:CHASE2 domain-containing protein n=1 Tax=Leptolyngbya sp. 'hensonii' TaxID=1922337 RepID=UPI0009500339|nr:adenylate/guanylate cyclase domain-containing protein [Leptolyngbya sp. 'hensonii']OLP17580.1 adenylate/guanylate cyclase domain-containing protein [Leptolyngbya sp. 'hensonii']
MVIKFFQRIRDAKPDLTGLLSVVISSATATGLILGLRSLGWLQSLELKAYDQMVQLRPDPGPDPRFLVVGITEDDNKKYGVPFSDRDLAKVLRELQRHQPRVIGLDIYRDLPQEPGHAELAKEFKASNIIAITTFPVAKEDRIIPPPASISPDQVGFNDVVTDPDNVVRRNLYLVTPSGDAILPSFAFQVAQMYLQPLKLEPQLSEDSDQNIEWGQALLVPLEKNSGGYQDNDPNSYQILLNYRTHKRIATRVSLSDVLDGRVAPELIKDKIILIGSIAPSAKDFFNTPFSAAERIDPKMPGVEVHAQMVSQFLDAVTGARPLFWFWSEWGEILWISGWSVLGGVLAWRLRHPVVLGLGGTAALGTVLGSGFIIFLHQGWIPVITPALNLLLTGMAVVAYRAQQAQRQQQMTMTLLGQNASPEIAAALWNSRDRLMQDGKLPGQKLTATMLFTDIKNFSTISEQMLPEDLLNWLNEYLSVMTREVQLYHGIVNKFTGDGLIAVFGVPVARETREAIAADACNAVACALSMGENLQLLNQDWKQRGLPCIQIRVGIFTGPIVAGSLGGKERLEYGIIGDSVNTASRLESVEKDRQGGLCRILIAHETYEYTRDKFQVENWGYLALKGKQHMVDVYQVLARLSETNPAPEANSFADQSGGNQEHSPSESDINSSNLNAK